MVYLTTMMLIITVNMNNKIYINRYKNLTAIIMWRINREILKEAVLGNMICLGKRGIMMEQPVIINWISILKIGHLIEDKNNLIICNKIILFIHNRIKR